MSKYHVTMNAAGAQVGEVIDESHPAFENLRRAGVLVPARDSGLRDKPKPDPVVVVDEETAEAEDASSEEAAVEDESSPRRRSRRSSGDDSTDEPTEG